MLFREGAFTVSLGVRAKPPFLYGGELIIIGR